MSVRYIRVKAIGDLFSPVIRPTGNIAIIGPAATGTDDAKVQITSPVEAATEFGPSDGSLLTAAVQLVMRQSPGPGQVWAIKAAGAGNQPVADPTSALITAEGLDVQFVLLAGTPLNTDDASAIGALADHVKTVSEQAGDGKERMGIAMLESGASSPAVITGSLADDRMIYIAHRSQQDAAAAVAGTIAGYDPHVSVLLKQVSIDSEPFTSKEIDELNGSETFASGPAGKGVNWLVDPPLIPGAGVYLGEGYTGNPGGKKYIDVVRTIDDVSFKLKANLIRSVGAVRISRSGLRALTVQLETVLDRLQADEVIEGYRVVIPVLELLDANPAALSAAQQEVINQAQTTRAVEIFAAVDYAGAIHRIAITLKFE